MSNVYAGLLHYPIYNKNDEIVTTAITNYDIHDIARTARTYDINRYFIIHPLANQRQLAQDIIDYWTQGYGGEHHPDRREAFSIIGLATDLAAAIERIKEDTGKLPLIVTTDARKYDNTVSYRELRDRIHAGTDEVFLLLFGTGWGIEKATMRQFDYILEPVYGPCDYNHLPVRAAVAIILDRLLGEEWY